MFIVEMGFHRVGQAGLEPLTADDPLASASPSAGIAGVSHCAWAILFGLNIYLMILRACRILLLLAAATLLIVSPFRIKNNYPYKLSNFW